MIHYEKNQKINGIVFLREIEPFIRNNGYKRRRAIFICPFCNREFEATIEQIKGNRNKSCGCSKGKLISKAKTVHGKTNTPLYYVWHNMKVRCYNKNNYHYEWYGERGIRICDEWRSDFSSFYDWAMLSGWEKGLTIDRIDNDGNYEPDNCRFVTQKQNVNNSRDLRKTNKTGHRHIGIHKSGFRVIINKKHIGLYSCIEDAIVAKEKVLKNINSKEL